MYGYDKEAQAYWLATGENGIKTGIELGKLSLKNNVDPNTLIKSPSFDGSLKFGRRSKKSCSRYRKRK